MNPKSTTQRPATLGAVPAGADSEEVIRPLSVKHLWSKPKNRSLQIPTGTAINFIGSGYDGTFYS